MGRREYKNMTEVLPVVPKKRVNSKKKGNSHELVIAKALSKNLSPLEFKRVTNSGATLGGINSVFVKKYGEEICKIFIGDVTCINNGINGIHFNFCIECKSYKTREDIVAMINGKSDIYKWMNESRIDAAKANLLPLLIFKYNNTPIYVCVDKDNLLPNEINYISLINGDKVCLFDDLIQYTSFWITNK